MVCAEVDTGYRSDMAFLRLSDRTLAQAGNDAWRGGYDRANVGVGVVHLGPGAFHRAHQAPVYDRLLAHDPRWGVCGVSLKSPGVSEALTPQDGLYTLVELDREVSFTIIGAMKAVLTAQQTPALVLAQMAAPQTRLFSLTVTEKGYCLNGAGELDLAHPDIALDIARPAVPNSAVGWLVAGLRARHGAGAPAPTVMSCDNLTNNGGKLGRAVTTLARAQGDAVLADWIELAVAFPNSMVDSITPATDEALKTRVREAIGLDDAWPIQRERFTQWVIENRFAAGAPDLAAAGVTVVSDVRPFEQAKLRLLNGAHSSLAYIGLTAGFETVADAMADPDLARFVERLMRIDIAPSLAPSADLDLPAYIGAILERFRNPAIRHRLAQIAWDGSQKLPFRLLGTIADALDVGRPIERLCVPVAAWMLFAAGAVRRGETLVDPLAAQIAAIADAPLEAQVEGFLALDTVFPRRLAGNPRFAGAVASAHQALADGRMAAVLAL